MQSDFEAMGGSYHQEGDYLLPTEEIPGVCRSVFWVSIKKHITQLRRNVQCGCLYYDNYVEVTQIVWGKTSNMILALDEV